MDRHDCLKRHTEQPEAQADYRAVFQGNPVLQTHFHPDQILSLFVSYNFFVWSVHQYFHKPMQMLHSRWVSNYLDI